ncbi:Random slug protein 5 [Porphyridium purpureum]|uniref:Random slug protein 5 n=1 Tax=Porphyridium purpureum TaxID=35688 RepID=A0A5J4YXA7_PORPP|nr:Random slug protein 5 [Porphyridium purpureum]|eukprot:POR1123..scf209_3
MSVSETELKLVAQLRDRIMQSFECSPDGTILCERQVKCDGQKLSKNKSLFASLGLVRTSSGTAPATTCASASENGGQVAGEGSGRMDGEQAAALESFLSDATYVRFLRARDLDLDKAENMLRTSIDWRLEKRPERWRCEVCRENPRGHALRVLGRVGERHEPVFYSQFTDVENRSPEDNERHFVWMMEHCFQESRTEPNPHSFIWVCDFEGFGVADLNPRNAQRTVMTFLDNYPERLRQAILISPPRLFFHLWKLVAPWLDERTRSKITMISASEAAEILKPLLGEECYAAVCSEMQLFRATDEASAPAPNVSIASSANWWERTHATCPSQTTM